MFASTRVESVFVGAAGFNVTELIEVGVPTASTKLEFVVKIPSVTLSVMVDVPS